MNVGVGCVYVNLLHHHHAMDLIWMGSWLDRNVNVVAVVVAVGVKEEEEYMC